MRVSRGLSPGDGSKSVALNPVAQSRPSNAQQLSGARLVAAGVGQDRRDQRSFDFADDEIMQVVGRGRAHILQILLHGLLHMLIQTSGIAGECGFQRGP